MEDRVWNLIDTRNICYGGEWKDVQSTIKANLFSIMLELAQDRVKYFKSDLFHDAIWLNETITDCMQFDWVARESGTFIGESASYHKVEDWKDSVKYRFEIRTEDNAKWIVNIYEAGPLKDKEDLGAKYRDAMQEEFIIQEEFQPYLINESLPESVMEALVNTDVNPINWNKETVEEIVTSYKAEEISVLSDSESFSPFEIPTLRNESTVIRERKEDATVQSLIESLREKLDEATSARDEASEKKYELDDVIGELENYIDEVDNLIGSLDNLPEISVECEIDIRFES